MPDPGHTAQETRPNARLIFFLFEPRAWSCPWQHPKHCGLIDPFSAQSETIFWRCESPPLSDERPQQGQHGARRSVSHVPDTAESRFALRALTFYSIGTSAARVSAACPRGTEPL